MDTNIYDRDWSMQGVVGDGNFNHCIVVLTHTCLILVVVFLGNTHDLGYTPPKRQRHAIILSRSPLGSMEHSSVAPSPIPLAWNVPIDGLSRPLFSATLLLVNEATFVTLTFHLSSCHDSFYRCHKSSQQGSSGIGTKARQILPVDNPNMPIGSIAATGRYVLMLL
ncbi:hypothetical protein EV356DRAFT_47505 [Viridothelium virens]|uniref:Uncharacterized protein n=1 Tax=Viridothelium virens TaxID=1048519 RepID=A0A6A6GT37_VIRVR|nr:hypothetical protein EV356DRAFT_47505 [Viridothelium virens]